MIHDANEEKSMAETESTTVEAKRAPLSELLVTHAKGAVDAEAGEKLAEVVAAVAETEKAGSLTLKFSVKPLDNSGGAVQITVEVSHKPPQHPPAASIWFATDEGALSRQHPDQLTIHDFTRDGDR